MCAHTLKGNFGSDVSVTLKVTFDLHSTEWQLRANMSTHVKHKACKFDAIHSVVAHSTENRFSYTERRDSHLGLPISRLNFHKNSSPLSQLSPGV